MLLSLLCSISTDMYAALSGVQIYYLPQLFNNWRDLLAQQMESSKVVLSIQNCYDCLVLKWGWKEVKLILESSWEGAIICHVNQSIFWPEHLVNCRTNLVWVVLPLKRISLRSIYSPTKYTLVYKPIIFQKLLILLE